MIQNLCITVRIPVCHGVCLNFKLEQFSKHGNERKRMGPVTHDDYMSVNRCTHISREMTRENGTLSN